MSSTIAIVEERLSSNLNEFSNKTTQAADALPLSRDWIDAETASHSDKRAINLLIASRLSLLETATSWAIGLNRAAIGSLRTYIENSVSWLYYKDHPVEYRMIEAARADLMLPKAVQKYLASVDVGHITSYKFLEQTCSRPNEYYYTDISACVHAHPNFIVAGKSTPELVVSTPPDIAFLDMCKFADEFINDQFLTTYRHSWGAIPLTAQTAANTRLGSKLADFLAVP